MVSADWRASNVATRSEGTVPSPRLIRLSTCRSASACVLSTEIEIGVFCRLVSRRVAVTTISDRPSPAMEADVGADAVESGVALV